MAVPGLGRSAWNRRCIVGSGEGDLIEWLADVLSSQGQIDTRRNPTLSHVPSQSSSGAEEWSGFQGRQGPTSPSASTHQANYRATPASQNQSQQYSPSNYTVNYGGGQTQSSGSTQPTYHGSRSGRTNTGSGQSLPRGQGAYIQGDYVAGQSLHYEQMNPSFYVRDSGFFSIGKVFAVMWNETASATARPTDYNTSKSLTQVKYAGNYVHTNVRRFIVVRSKREFCFACPIFTYSGRATLKGGVRPEQHAIAYSWGGTAQLLEGESGIIKTSISVVMVNNNPALDIASRIYFGIHHPIQYNVKVKEIGYVPSDEIATLIGNWREEDGRELGQASDVTANAEREELAPVNE